ncbi:uncharacterized protein Tco025E_10036, partial [Trypanosoma conorhini]
MAAAAAASFRGREGKVRDTPRRRVDCGSLSFLACAASFVSLWVQFQCVCLWPAGRVFALGVFCRPRVLCSQFLRLRSAALLCSVVGDCRRRVSLLRVRVLPRGRIGPLPPFSSSSLRSLSPPHPSLPPPHSLVYCFLPAAPQPTATLLPLFLLMPTLPTLRRRAGCALALLALLCGLCCCASVGDTAATATEATVEVSCSNTGNKLSWRFPGEAAWTPCRSSEMGERNVDCLHLCRDAEEQYQVWRCATACAGANESAVAFTMKYSLFEGERGFCRELPTSSAAAAAALSEKPDI